jgi:NAD(P)-dependent dehydrogenase (short-subunit alcohol dehydrogenase family)
MTSTQNRPAGTVAFDNSGRVAVVSGGNGGIGAAICRAFAESGACVVSLDVQPPPEDLSKDVVWQECDVSCEPQCQTAIQQTNERFGGIDVLVNNAAIQPPESYVRPDEVPLELWDKMLSINFTGYMLLAKHALSVMRRQGSGVIVNMSSGQGHRTARDVPIYGPVKAANILQARQWAVQYAREGIRVVSVSPGAVDTPMVRATLEKQGGAAALANRHPIGRLARPSEIAAAVLWLASPAASFVTGTDLEVDGGLGAFGSFADPFPIETVVRASG